MNLLLLALMDGQPFAGWSEMTGGDMIYLLPWFAVIYFLIPKSGSKSAASKPSAESGGGGLSLGTYAVVAVVAYVAVASGALDGMLG